VLRFSEFHHRGQKTREKKMVKLRYNLYGDGSLERKILAAFDRPGARKLSFADFGGAALSQPDGSTSPWLPNRSARIER